MYLSTGGRASDPLAPGQRSFIERQVFVDEVGGRHRLAPGERQPWSLFLSL